MCPSHMSPKISVVALAFFFAAGAAGLLSVSPKMSKDEDALSGSSKSPPPDFWAPTVARLALGSEKRESVLLVLSDPKNDRAPESNTEDVSERLRFTGCDGVLLGVAFLA